MGVQYVLIIAAALGLKGSPGTLHNQLKRNINYISRFLLPLDKNSKEYREWTSTNLVLKFLRQHKPSVNHILTSLEFTISLFGPYKSQNCSFSMNRNEKIEGKKYRMTQGSKQTSKEGTITLNINILW